jgi:hypothetical protein
MVVSKALTELASDTVPPRRETLFKLLRLVEFHADLCHTLARLPAVFVTCLSLCNGYSSNGVAGRRFNDEFHCGALWSKRPRNQAG